MRRGRPRDEEKLKVFLLMMDEIVEKYVKFNEKGEIVAIDL